MMTLFSMMIASSLALIAYNPCLNCNSPNVTAYFDGCNQCTCTTSSNGAKVAACTELACIALAADPNECARSCDGKRVPSPTGYSQCVCVNGAAVCGDEQATGDRCRFVTCQGNTVCQVQPDQTPQWKCVEQSQVSGMLCGCDGKTRCQSGQTCTDDGKCAELPTSMWVSDGAPGCVRGPNAGQCCGTKFSDSCVKGEACVKGACVAEGAFADSCDEPANECTTVNCGPGKICVPTKRQCFTTPCPQYDCVEAPDANVCGCANPDGCKTGMTCADNKCIATVTPTIPAGAADGTPICLRAGSVCCGTEGGLCGDDEVCDQNKCIKRTECAPVATTTTGQVVKSETEITNDDENSAPVLFLFGGVVAVALFAAV